MERLDLKKFEQMYRQLSLGTDRSLPAMPPMFRLEPNEYPPGWSTGKGTYRRGHYSGQPAHAPYL
jgi:hypothetical protein